MATPSFHQALDRASHHATGVPAIMRRTVVIAASSIVRLIGCQMSEARPCMVVRTSVGDAVTKFFDDRPRLFPF